MHKENKLEKIRHSLSHLLAMAVLEKDPDAKLGIGPTTADGFYYDFDFSGSAGNEDSRGLDADSRRRKASMRGISIDDLPVLEARMEELIAEKLDFKHFEMSANEAREKFKEQPYKLELIEEIIERGEKLSFYQTGGFIDLCGGPHVKNTKEIDTKAFTLTRTAGAYWRGDEKNMMLTRIYGAAFGNKKELDEYLEMQKEAERRDHRKLGRELELFVFSDEVGAGLPLWLPKGTIIRDELEKWARETEEKWGYQHIVTPHITKKHLYEISGHLPYFKEDLYSPIDIEGEEYYLKPMNCPHTHMIYKARTRSYRELPLRLAEYGSVYRFERSGTLHGLMRVRGFCQNDAHIYVQPERAAEEFANVFKLHEHYYKILGIKDWHAVLGVRDKKNSREKYHGDDKMWEEAEKLTKKALDKAGVKYEIEEGNAAHYGPKADVVIKSVIGKEYAIGTDQLDLYMPERFGLKYTDKDGKEKMPYIIHRAPLGSHERMVGFLLEHYAGAFPLWLSPVQVKILTIGGAHKKYAEDVFKQLKESGIRAELDENDETLGKKIRNGKLQKIPYMLVIGDKEVKSKKVTVESRGKGNLGTQTPEEFIRKSTDEIRDKILI
jgi:threonyl-tRNA synthetase